MAFEMTPNGSPDRALARSHWLRASRTTATASLPLLLLSRGEKAPYLPALRALPLDWTTLNPYAVGLFGVPMLSGLCLWTIWAARYCAKASDPRTWVDAVPTKIDPSQMQDRRRATLLALMSVGLFILMPIIILTVLEGKFLNGTFYFEASGPFSCRMEKPPKCVLQGTGLTHFFPLMGLQSISDTPYRYEGNITYVPPWQPLLWVAMEAAVLVYAGLYFKQIASRRGILGKAGRDAPTDAPAPDG